MSTVRTLKKALLRNNNPRKLQHVFTPFIESINDTYHIFGREVRHRINTLQPEFRLGMAAHNTHNLPHVVVVCGDETPVKRSLVNAATRCDIYKHNEGKFDTTRNHHIRNATPSYFDECQDFNGAIPGSPADQFMKELDLLTYGGIPGKRIEHRFIVNDLTSETDAETMSVYSNNAPDDLTVWHIDEPSTYAEGIDMLMSLAYPPFVSLVTVKSDGDDGPKKSDMIEHIVDSGVYENMTNVIGVFVRDSSTIDTPSDVEEYVEEVNELSGVFDDVIAFVNYDGKKTPYIIT